jgi:NAD(P)-dependent dehydrogenase (short-subunit alcohol dehydrogenase family)
MVQNLFDLTGKVALITGANSGLGLAYARGMAKAGADVVIWGRRDAQNTLAANELKQYGGRVFTQQVDVSDETQVTAAMQLAEQTMGRLDCVIANAGISSLSPFTEMSSAVYHELLAVNLHGAFYTLREAAKSMTARAKKGDIGGSLIVCGSLSIFGGVPQLAHYAAAKGALNSMVKTMALELGPQQIRVNVIAPGFIATEMTKADAETFKMLDQAVSAKTALGRSGEPEDLEGIAVYLASDCSKYHTGDSLVIDGGQLLGLM